MASAPPEVSPLTAPPPITPAGAILPISGVDGYIALCLGSSLPRLAEPFVEYTNTPGGSRTFTHTLYSVVDRGKKIADSRVPPIVRVNTTQMSPTLYRWFPGGAFVLFFAPLASTDAVTVDYNFIPTQSSVAPVVNGEVYGLLHVNNWQMNLTANPIPGDEYGTMMAPQYRGKMAGTWQFERYSAASAIDLYMLMMTSTYFVISLYESLIQQRQWIIYGDVSASPMSAPTAGMVGGTVTGTMVAQPSLIVEQLSVGFLP